MILHAGHAENGRLFHFTHTSLFHEGLCGEPVTLDGAPDPAILCPVCLEHARAAGLDVSIWIVAAERGLPLPLAA